MLSQESSSSIVKILLMTSTGSEARVWARGMTAFTVWCFLIYERTSGLQNLNRKKKKRDAYNKIRKSHTAPKYCSTQHAKRHEYRIHAQLNSYLAFLAALSLGVGLWQVPCVSGIILNLHDSSYHAYLMNWFWCDHEIGPESAISVG